MNHTILSYNEAGAIRALADTVIYVDQENEQHFTRDMKDALEVGTTAVLAGHTTGGKTDDFRLGARI